MQKLIKNKELIIVFILLLIGFLVRLKGLSLNYSFWTDEDHVAIFAGAILERDKPVLINGYSTGIFQYLWYWITAFSMKLFGINELAARIPGVIFGALTIPAVYFLGKKLYDEKVGLSASIITTFLNIEILWSRQARPYQAIQFIYIIEILVFLKLLEQIENKKNILVYLLCLLVLIIASSLMHWFGLAIIPLLFAYLLLIRRDIIQLIFYNVKKYLIKKTFLGGLLIICIVMITAAVLYRIGFFIAIKGFIFPAYGKIGYYNHFSYYHSFLWRQYGLLSFLAIIGFLISMQKNFKKNSVLIIIFALFFGYINFRLRVPFTRYLYPVFFIIIIWSSNALCEIACILNKHISPKTPEFIRKNIYLLLILFIVANGYKFTIKPKNYYSLNNDMQEIPEVSYKEIYKLIKEKTNNEKEWLMITTWPDHATWYLGEGKPDYWLRKKEVLYGETKDVLSGAEVIDSIDQLKNVIKSNKKGIILIESWETFIPEGIEEYVKINMKKEAEFDRIYPVQPRYWPVNIYSWGIK